MKHPESGQSPGGGLAASIAVVLLRRVLLPFIEKFLVTNWVTIVLLFEPFRSFNLFLEAAVLRSRCLLLVSLRAFRNSSVSSLSGKPFETRLPTTSSAVLPVLKLTVPDDD